MRFEVFWRVAVVQLVAVAAASLVLAAVFSHGFFETWGWLAGPATWLGCAWVTARVVGLVPGPTLTRALIAGVVSALAVLVGLHWLGLLVAVGLFAYLCARDSAVSFCPDEGSGPERRVPVSWGVTDIPDLSGRTAVVTGANGGLGLETARALAAAGANVVIAARHQQRAAQAMESIRSSAPGASLTLVELDLGSLESIRSAAAEMLNAHQTIDLLVNNAGVMGIPEQRTADGFEMQFGVDHLGHFALTALLIPALLRADAARVVTVTSTAHHMGRAVDPENPHLHGRYRPWRAYGQAKLANFHFGIGLHRLLSEAGSPAASLIAHPGLSNTELQAVSVKETDGGLSQRFFLMLARSVGMSPAEGALSQLRAATDPGASSGEFYGPLFVNNGPPVRKPILRRAGMGRAIARLWEVSERETGLKIET